MKRTLRSVVRQAFRAIPFDAALQLARYDRRLLNQLPPGHRVRFDRYHGSYRVDLDTTYPIERQMLSGEYDPDTAAVIRRFVAPGGVALDVGANVGAHTLLLAKQVGPAGRVYAFEPGPPIFERLKRNLALNPSADAAVVCERLGLADEEGTLFWNEEAHNRGNAHLKDGLGTAVPVTTLDRYFAGHSTARIDFVKIDVETMEYRVLLGARETLARFRPALYVETLALARPFLEERYGMDVYAAMERYLAGLGYALYAVDGDRLERVDSSGLPDNTLALPDHR